MALLASPSEVGCYRAPEVCSARFTGGGSAFGEHVCLVSFGLACPGEVSGSFLLPPRSEVAHILLGVVQISLVVLESPLPLAPKPLTFYNRKLKGSRFCIF